MASLTLCILYMTVFLFTQGCFSFNSTVTQIQYDFMKQYYETSPFDTFIIASAVVSIQDAIQDQNSNVNVSLVLSPGETFADPCLLTALNRWYPQDVAFPDEFENMRVFYKSGGNPCPTDVMQCGGGKKAKRIGITCEAICATSTGYQTSRLGLIGGILGGIIGLLIITVVGCVMYNRRKKAQAANNLIVDDKPEKVDKVRVELETY